MADTLSMALAELLRKADAEPDLDTLREGVRVMTQALMELEVAQHLGTERPPVSWAWRHPRCTVGCRTVSLVACSSLRAPLGRSD